MLDKVPDLSPHWVDRSMQFLPYLPHNNESSANFSEKDEVVDVINVDISHLLKKKYNHFWSQILFDTSVQKFIDTYLRYKTRPFEPTFQKNSSPTHEALYKRVFRLLLRISTNRESM